MKKILFVCTGNTCRSPMAAGIFNHLAEEIGLDAKAFSRGIAVYSTSPATDKAVSAAGAYGVDIDSHESQNITENDLKIADRVYGMTEGHVRALISQFPQYKDKIFSIPTGDIPDPYGGSLEIYEEIARRISLAIKNILSSLKAGDEGSDGDKNKAYDL
ncbi:MAG: low molecular weight protein arginine phosphatase [Eubacteriales bacterium]|jgi:protein-tyrosine-phosphatase